MSMISFRYHINNITEINRRVEKIVESHTKEGFWSHYCRAQKDMMYFEHGVPCDWCGHESHEYRVHLKKDEKPQ